MVIEVVVPCHICKTELRPETIGAPPVWYDPKDICHRLGNIKGIIVCDDCVRRFQRTGQLSPIGLMNFINAPLKPFEDLFK